MGILGEFFVKDRREEENKGIRKRVLAGGVYSVQSQNVRHILSTLFSFSVEKEKGKERREKKQIK